MTGIALIGRGRLGTSLARALAGKKIPARFARAKEIAGLRAAGIVILSVPDGTIAGLARELAAEKAKWRGKIVLHTSGLLGSRVLLPLKLRGASCGSFHPMQAFPRRNMPPSHFEGVPVGIEGDPAARRAAAVLARSLGARPFVVRAADKPVIHCACSLASNLFVPLFAMAAGLLEEAGFNRRKASQLLAPLVEGTLRNVKQLDARRALTGPISRGDLATVRTHLEVLRRHPDAARAYRILGQEAVGLAEQAGLDKGKVRAMFRLLGGKRPLPRARSRKRP